ncbi:MAG: CDP-diacylglycerol--glycerol-3-phosphate 3-phosphatidyltransferase [Candidatus Sumerlaeaceae bacterium]|nr:CDP-diacylglycerol--glycerol-3-phosphate 3-phosphatidyltransferase [Candidatus Sumerlaeaceae bacterium]
MQLNIANRLTLIRIGLIPFFVTFVLVDNLTTDPLLIFASRIAATVVFLVAAITDMLDGYLARRYNLITNFGKLMDPLADKLLTMSAFVAFVEIDYRGNHPVFPAWAIIVILGREFLVTGLRALALERGRVIQADHLGKHKTIMQLVGIIIVLVGLCVRDFLRWRMPNGLSVFDDFFTMILILVLIVIVTLTTASGVQYLWKNRDLLWEPEKI